MEQVSSTPQANFNEIKPGGTYKITFRKIARAALAELRVHKKIAIISYVLFGVATLLFMFNAHYYGSYGSRTVSFEPSFWGIGFCVMGVMVGYFAALNVFRDVNNQQLCDVTMALPIKAAERFWSKLLALVFLQVGPLVISTLCGNAIAMLFGTIGHGKLDSEAYEYLTFIVLGALSCSLFIMAVTVFCTCCSGAKAESAYFSLIMMFIINALPITFVDHIIGTCSGFERGFFYSSAGNGIDVKFWGFLPLFSSTYNGIGEYVYHNVISIAISLCVMCLSIFIYKKRDARTVGAPISSRLFFEIFLVLGCFTIFSFFVFYEGAWWGVLIAGVIYIIINIIVSRAKINVMSFFTWIVKYTVTTAVFIAVMVVTIKTGGFGQIYSRPSAKYLEGARFSISCWDNRTRHELYTGALTPEQANQVMEITKKHMIKGFNELSAAGILTDSVYYDSIATVRVRASSETQFRDRPLSMRHFDERTVWVQNSDYSYTVYELDYDQHLTISTSEIRAMCDELDSLDFVYHNTYENGKQISSKYGGEPVTIADEDYNEYYW